MANGTGPTRFDPEARYAALDERVTNVGSRLTAFEANTSRSFAQLENSFASLATDLRNTQRPQWQALGVMLTAITIIGALAYWPLREGQSDLKAGMHDTAEVIAGLPKTYISNDVADILRARSAEDRVAIQKIIDGLQVGKVGYPEWLQRQDTLNREIAELNKRVDEMRTEFGGTYSLRDAIVDLKSRLERVEAERLAAQRERPAS